MGIARGLSRRIAAWRNQPERVRWGNLRRLRPFSNVFGLDRGQPICRYYIEEFLARNAEDIRGRVLEIADDGYTKRYGAERVVQSDVLHLLPGNRKATIVADLTDGRNIPSDAYDCIILTQTLPSIYDPRAALRTVYRVLRPGGVLLASIPGIAQVSRYDADRWGDYWRLTLQAAQRLFEEFWSSERLRIEHHGNVLVAVAYLLGLASRELGPDELAVCDPDYPVTITIRAEKAAAEVSAAGSAQPTSE